jgi:hypothetical protein
LGPGGGRGTKKKKKERAGGEGGGVGGGMTEPVWVGYSVTKLRDYVTCLRMTRFIPL